MSKYTTEVRFICESKSGLEVPAGSSDVDIIIANSWNKIFTSKAPFFDEEYRSVLCQKILKHYYLREICCETVGIWTLWMNTRLEEIMPYYNQLYKSAQIDFNPLHDTEITRTHNRKLDESRDDKRNITGTRNNTTENSLNATNRDLYSDTPQGALTGIENETYLTNARKITETSNTNVSDDTSFTEKNDTNGNLNSTEDYLETVVGKQGGESFSSLLNKYRETILNIDMQIIKEFNDLFMGLW